MNLADYPKKIYAQERKEGSNEIYCLDYRIDDEDIEYTRTDLAKSDNFTFRERLIVALASNPNVVITFQCNDDRFYPDTKTSAEEIIKQADAIIKQLEESK